MTDIDTNRQLCIDMPYLIPRNLFTDKVDKDYNYGYIRGVDELPIGWQKLFLQMAEDIKQPLIDAGYLDKFRFSQIKEKYGEMCCYTFGAPETVLDIISKYEHLSQYVCCHCGKLATRVTSGYILPYCDDCIDFGSDFTPIEFNSYFTIVTTGPNGESKKEKVDCSQEWERLMEATND